MISHWSGVLFPLPFAFPAAVCHRGLPRLFCGSSRAAVLLTRPSSLEEGRRQLRIPCAASVPRVPASLKTFLTCALVHTIARLQDRGKQRSWTTRWWQHHVFKLACSCVPFITRPSVLPLAVPVSASASTRNTKSRHSLKVFYSRNTRGSSL